MAVKAIVVRHKKAKHGRRQKGKWRLVIFHPGWSATASSTSCTTCCTSPPSTWHQIHRRQQKLVWSFSTLGGLLLLHPLLVLLLLACSAKYIEDNKSWSGHMPSSSSWVFYHVFFALTNIVHSIGYICTPGWSHPSFMFMS